MAEFLILRSEGGSGTNCYGPGERNGRINQEHEESEGIEKKQGGSERKKNGIGDRIFYSVHNCQLTGNEAFILGSQSTTRLLPDNHSAQHGPLQSPTYTMLLAHKGHDTTPPLKHSLTASCGSCVATMKVMELFPSC